MGPPRTTRCQFSKNSRMTPFSIDQFNTTVEALLTRCWRGYYETRGNGEREFQRDLPRLRLGILRYGKECSDRGWEFDLDHFERALVALLNDLLPRADNIKFLPLYLESAVRRHIDQRAEELNLKNKRDAGLDHVVGNVLKKMKRVEGDIVTVFNDTAATEMAAQLWKQMKEHARRKARDNAAKRRSANQPCEDLFATQS